MRAVIVHARRPAKRRIVAAWSAASRVRQGVVSIAVGVGRGRRHVTGLVNNAKNGIHQLQREYVDEAET